MTILATERLRLEPLDDRHFDGLHAMNRLPDVMRYISGEPETPEQTRASIAVVKERWTRHGFSWWAFIERETDRLVGAGCIQYLGRDPANPLEIGWRLVPDKWGQGLATEAASAMMAWAFDTLGAPLLVAICHPENADSARVMGRLGMRYRGLENWYGKPHAVYEISSARPPAPAARPDRPA
ncbi:GNAT family N-acetyltransferase [Massilia sp. Dwa41.01b]|uniref:GNAT family N-acetyltransferase n=1 Tax=unclassified Massilia TaxID=2609279 RepID=UPI00160210CF|nr:MULTISPECIES: GNAT family N-acetyltransferase [unclassified Massilia]QNA89371.1 GNAT family N-acetyltransferase [Massilia sp. Dwa41.01b]QNB00266.1 GNAT family N-acetyltransferase [Massilia sp. Se16.2.3]